MGASDTETDSLSTSLMLNTKFSPVQLRKLAAADYLPSQIATSVENALVFKAIDSSTKTRRSGNKSTRRKSISDVIEVKRKVI